MAARKTAEKESAGEAGKPPRQEYDFIVVGGGPGGSSTAAFLGKAGKSVLIVDRATFPREKVCGDGISGKSVRVLRELGMTEAMKEIEHLDMYGVTFSSPKGVVLHVPVPREAQKSPPGYVCRREVFDNMLFQNAKKYATALEQFVFEDFIREGDKVSGITGTYMPTKEKMTFRAKAVVCADGAGGLTTRKLGVVNNREEHQCSALRAYYEGVEGMSDRIELHFVKEALPGYFWIFPLPGKRANVGIGMLVSDMKKQGANLEKIMYDVIGNNPLISKRFRNAKKVTDIKRWHLPLGSWRPPRTYGNGYLLVGDCASLIDPFSGEGIGNALTSGKIASDVLLDADGKGDFSGSALSVYHKKLYDEVGDELDTSYKLQRLGTNQWLLNMVVDKAVRSEYVRGAISSTLINPEGQKQFHNPLFLLRVLLA